MNFHREFIFCQYFIIVKSIPFLHFCIPILPLTISSPYCQIQILYVRTHIWKIESYFTFALYSYLHSFVCFGSSLSQYNSSVFKKISSKGSVLDLFQYYYWYCNHSQTAHQNATYCDLKSKGFVEKSSIQTGFIVLELQLLYQRLSI